MKFAPTLGTIAIAPSTLAILFFAISSRAQNIAPSTRPAGERVNVVFTGGHETDPRDGGRPVVLIAAALNVPADVFREAFSHVTPARRRAPTGDEQRRNKQELLLRLSKYGVTNERLDEVSDYYRYRPQEGELWTHRDASAVAMVKDGKIIGFEITDPGAGYSSQPEIVVPGVVDQTLVTTLDFNKNLPSNGSLHSLAVESRGKP